MSIPFANKLPWKSFNEFFVSIVYFVQGSSGLVTIAGSVILREQLSLDFQQMGLIALATTLPWSVKPIFGILTDLVPIKNLRRKPYLHIGPLIGALGYLLIGLYGHDFQSFFLALLFANLGLSLTDVATDGFVVEESNEDNAGRIQGLTQASIRAAVFITSFFSGILIFNDILSPHQMYMVLALFPLITFAASFFITERGADEIHLFEAKAEDSISTESSLEQRATKKMDIKIFTPAYLSTLIIVFAAIITRVVFNASINPWLVENVWAYGPEALTTAIWTSFGIWMICYFNKLKKLGLANTMIFVAILFILLWRITPDSGGSMFFYIKDTLGIDVTTIGYVNTLSNVGSIIGVLLAVKFFDKIKLKKLLAVTVVISAIYTLSTFAITNPEWAKTLGSTKVFTLLGTLVAFPVYFFDSLFNTLVTGVDFANPWTVAHGLSPLEKFFFLQSIGGEMIYMIAYIPLLKLAVLITPKKAEATNFAIITSVMNLALGISAWLSGTLYNSLMGAYHPDLPVEAIQVDVIEILIWVNIATTLSCLLVLPFLKTKQFLPSEK